MKKQLLYSFLILSFITISCNKTQERAFYPPVNEYINITLPQYQNLIAPGGWAYVNGGLKGIIVYRRGIDEFVAYDRNCTYNEANSCGSGTVNSSNVFIDCDCDGSQYSIWDGSVNKSPASFPLKGYKTTFNSSNNTLRVFN